ncbi:hypothetical protein KEM56_004700, partial [Ascosphaera pollenicola]
MRNRTSRYLTGANPKLVQSWNKYNLYHLKHLRLPPTHTKRGPGGKGFRANVADWAALPNR